MAHDQTQPGSFAQERKSLGTKLDLIEPIIFFISFQAEKELCYIYIPAEGTGWYRISPSNVSASPLLTADMLI